MSGEQRINDYVFPIATAEKKGDEQAIRDILGTAFLIGGRGFALTAGHTILKRAGDDVVGMFVSPAGAWLGFDVIARESHPSEDVALIRLGQINRPSFFRLSDSAEYSSCEYQLWGYPEDVYFEAPVAGVALPRPDLVFNQGYVRRRYTGEIPGFRGKSFYELSEIAGGGTSGAPIVKKRPPRPQPDPMWNVIGIYVGERTDEEGRPLVSYAVREEAFRDWAPSILGRSVLEESRTAAA